MIFNNLSSWGVLGTSGVSVLRVLGVGLSGQTPELG